MRTMLRRAWDPKSGTGFLADYVDVALVLELEFTTHALLLGTDLVANLDAIAQHVKDCCDCFWHKPK